jgi:hypothetical protein
VQREVKQREDRVIRCSLTNKTERAILGGDGGELAGEVGLDEVDVLLHGEVIEHGVVVHVDDGPGEPTGELEQLLRRAPR